MPPPSVNKAGHSGFEIQRKRHQKSKTGVSVVPQKRTHVLQKTLKKDTLYGTLYFNSKLLLTVAPIKGSNNLRAGNGEKFCANEDISCNGYGSSVSDLRDMSWGQGGSSDSSIPPR